MVYSASPAAQRHVAAWFIFAVCALSGGLSTSSRGDAYDPPVGYYSSATGTGSVLKQQLYAITIQNFTYHSYGDSRYSLGTLWQNPSAPADQIAIYSSANISATWDAGVTWNREHIATESSLGIKVSNTYSGYGSDEFELAPAVVSDNEARENYGYGYTGSTSTPSHTAYGTQAGTDGNTYWNAGTEFKGDVARSLFYMATRYGFNQGTGTLDSGNKYDVTLANGVPNTTGQSGDLNTLLHWAYEDPVDTFERRKNSLIYSGLVVNGTNYSQGNRNPYIDHPEYIWAVFGTGANTSQISVATPASDGSSSASISLGRTIVGNNFTTGAVTVNKTGTTPTTFNVASAGSATSSLTGTGETFTYGAGNKAMTVGLTASATPGPVSGAVTVHNTDLTTAGAGQGSADGDDTVTVVGTAVDHSDASFSSTSEVKHLTLSFGTVAESSGTQMQSFSLANLLSASGYTAGLNLTAIAGSGDTSSLYTNLGTFTAQAAGTSSSYFAALNTSIPGAFSAEYALSVGDENIPGATSGQSLYLDLNGTVSAPEPAALAGLLAMSIASLRLRRRRGVQAHRCAVDG